MDISKGRYWDKAWSLVDGCTPCSPGCDHCWSAAMTHRFNKNDFPLTHLTRGFRDYGKFNGNIVFRLDRLDVPLKTRKPTVYAVWNDLFHESVPGDFILHAYKNMFNCPHHTFLILTKRPEVMTEFFLNTSFMASNIYHGLTVCNQDEWDKKKVWFLQIRGKLFISHEPALERIDYGDDLKKIAVLISGGETGEGARATHSDIFRSDRDQCAAAGVPFFFKHHGSAWTKQYSKPGYRENYALDGRTHDDLPWKCERRLT